jgi:capsular polysaccharide transport system ATP-binding protein
LIHLLSVEKSFPGQRGGLTVVLRSTTTVVPTDRRIAILAERREGKTVLLRLLGGVEAPDRGEVVTSLLLSPVVNAGALFHPQLTGLENIRFFARMFGLDADRLTLVIDAFCSAGGSLEYTIRSQDANHRKVLELALISIIPYDCYLLDDIGQFGEEAVLQHFAAAARRKAGVIFTTSRPRLVHQFADCAMVLRDGTLHPFTRVDEAIRFYER